MTRDCCTSSGSKDSGTHQCNPTIKPPVLHKYLIFCGLWVFIQVGYFDPFSSSLPANHILPSAPGRLFRLTPFTEETFSNALLSMVHSPGAAAPWEIMKKENLGLHPRPPESGSAFDTQVTHVHIIVWEAVLLHPTTHVHNLSYSHTFLCTWFFFFNSFPWDLIHIP